jgi:hypothetical protein
MLNNNNINTNNKIDLQKLRRKCREQINTFPDYKLILFANENGIKID